MRNKKTQSFCGGLRFLFCVGLVLLCYGQGDHILAHDVVDEQNEQHDKRDDAEKEALRSALPSGCRHGDMVLFCVGD